MCWCSCNTRRLDALRMFCFIFQSIKKISASIDTLEVDNAWIYSWVV